VADDDDGTAAIAGEAALDRPVVAERAVAGERREVGEQRVDVVREVRPLGMAGDLRLLPGRELGVGLAQQLLGTGLEARDLLAQAELAVAGGKVAQLLDLALELADRLLEFEQLSLPSRACGRAAQPAFAAI
jgi:hypothetical protein